MSRRSRTSTSRPALARYAAHARPLCPPPTTITSRLVVLTEAEASATRRPASPARKLTRPGHRPSTPARSGPSASRTRTVPRPPRPLRDLAGSERPELVLQTHELRGARGRRDQRLRRREPVRRHVRELVEVPAVGSDRAVRSHRHLDAGLGRQAHRIELRPPEPLELRADLRRELRVLRQLLGGVARS